MSNVRVANISFNNRAWLDGTYFHDTTPERIDIRTSGGEFFDEQHRFFVLICIEEGNGLKYAMKQRICGMNLTYLDQKKKMIGVWILVGEHAALACRTLPFPQRAMPLEM
jgi:hypothetical protein